MNARLPMNLKKFAAVCPLLISAFIVTPVQAAPSETLFLFRSPDAVTATRGSVTRNNQQGLLKLDEKGDLLIKYGGARFTVAYNDPADLLKPSDQPQYPQRERTATINGISLTASLSF